MQKICRFTIDDERTEYEGQTLREHIGLPRPVNQFTANAAARELVSLYRDRFSTIGLFENILYPQIPETLKTLRAYAQNSDRCQTEP
ncbi:hypothetical protein HCG51_04480 [Tolypothrix sp. PCC 7910]|uniref:hypothetical protein n=1 Tax=Tolypothrix sp. PCC 7910 TaxID=2099387 RepID=UPI0014278337|nr:hypothetical protein [Tolypothrix sp. PCC 7910]QIR35263.1 hypothetical protein HCG51_04480 [Tolypothrix sp. PCC 7910]